MSGSGLTLRPARADDLEAVRALVAAAYAVYVPRLGKPPGPMLDDYEARIGAGQAHVAMLDGALVGLVVLIEKGDHLLLDNVAVAPALQGRGIGGALVDFAIATARARGFSELRLYTHVKMTENIDRYRRLGFEETHRASEAGFERVYFRMPLAPSVASGR